MTMTPNTGKGIIIMSNKKLGFNGCIFADMYRSINSILKIIL
jgi:hypothetical protein